MNNKMVKVKPVHYPTIVRMGCAMRMCWLGFVCALLAAVNVQGENADAPVPEALDDWREWVLHGHEYRRCPFLYDSNADSAEPFICVWPGRLRVEATAEGGVFEQRWTVYGEQWVPLPGSAGIWPREVTRNGQAAVVVLRDGRPTLRLGSGEHLLKGRFVWSERPPSLPIPPAVGLLSLLVDGQPVALPRRDDGLWLGADDTQQQVADALAVHVYRRIQDAVPTRLETVLELDVAGRVREERIVPALPEGFLPLAIDSDLPVRLDAHGELRVQVRPGFWPIRIQARAHRVLASVAMAEPMRNMPAAEVWSYAGAPRLRATLPEGGSPVDSELAAHWPHLPAFELQAGQMLNIVEHSRGRQESDNELVLRRQLWLDFDRRGYTFVDNIKGTMRTGWRMDLARPYVLLSATRRGEELLVTRACDPPCAGDDPYTGVELRHSDVALQALGRIESVAAVPVSGWRSNMNVAATLNLPPGNKLLAAFGVDDAPQSWIDRWRLLDFFVLLVVVVATVRLFGRLAGLTALLALALSFHEPGAPVWTWLNLLAAVALARAAPEGRLQRWAHRYRIASAVLMLLFLLPFLFTQIRISAYPQLEPAAGRMAQTVGMFEWLSEQPASAPGPEPGVAAPRRTHSLNVRAQDVPAKSTILDMSADVHDAAAASTVHPRYEANALTQAGPGMPEWQWTPYRLEWTGPVGADRTMRLVVSPPWLTTMLRLLAVAALGLFSAMFVVEIVGRNWPVRLWRIGGGSAAVAVALAVAFAGDPAHAQTPSPDILEELQERLLAPPPCTPRCAEVIAAEVLVGESDISIQMQVHALASVAVPLPGAAGGWLPTRILRGESQLPAHRRGGSLWVRLDAGRHALTLHGPLPPGETLAVPFPARPRAVAVRSSHWSVAGIENGALSSGTLELTRLRQDVEGSSAFAAASPDWEARRLPTFVRVERTIHLRPLDWRVQTNVRRIAPATGAINIEVPLLDGESVATGTATVRNGNVLVAMPPTQALFSWHSALPRQPALTLTAADGEPWQEVWRFDVGSTWRVEFAGVPESLAGPDANALAQFHPRGGETLSVTIARPEATPGNTLAFDEVHLETTASHRWRDSWLTLIYRSTRGDSHRIRLPEEAKLKTVLVDGETVALGLVDGELGLPILRDDHVVEIAWQQAAELGLLTTTPIVQLGAPASNIVTTLELPSRWLLFATGPTLGAAILYWSELLTLVVASLILGRIRATPLATRHWLLLGLGFSTFSWLAFAVVAAWLLAHGARRAWGGAMSGLAYNLSQIGFGILTLLAFAAILVGIPSGLLGNPNMSVAGFESSGQSLSWFADKTDNATPSATVLSLPMWLYQALILAWALWLSLALMRWLPWIWQCFSATGLWHGKPPTAEQARQGGEQDKPQGSPASAETAP